MSASQYAFLIREMLNATLGGVNGPLHYFYNMMYGMEIDNKRFHPDISGYTLMFMIPPHLSGYGLEEGDAGPLGKSCRLICFLGLDFTPPNIQVTASELPAHTGALPFGMQVNPTGQLNITYVDNQYNHMFGFHKLWISYIEDILRGKKTSDGKDISPDSQYEKPSKDPDSRFGQIDYMASAYVVRTKPTRGLELGDINYVGKATGIFPLNMPDKELIGRRDSNEITMLPMSYAAAWYRQYTVGIDDNMINSGQDRDIFILKEFESKIKTLYSDGGNITTMNV